MNAFFLISSRRSDEKVWASNASFEKIKIDQTLLSGWKLVGKNGSETRKVSLQILDSLQTLAILKENSNYLTISFHYRLFHPLLTTCIAPLIILFCMNIRIYLGVRRLQQSQQRRRQNQERALQNGNSRQGSKQGKKDKKEIQMAGVALTIVLSFVALNMLRLILGFNEVLDIRQIATCMKHKVEFMRSMDSYTLDSLSRFLMIVNSSCNFIIYVSFNANFKVILTSYWVSQQVSNEIISNWHEIRTLIEIKLKGDLHCKNANKLSRIFLAFWFLKIRNLLGHPVQFSQVRRFIIYFLLCELERLQGSYRPQQLQVLQRSFTKKWLDKCGCFRQ